MSQMLYWCVELIAEVHAYLLRLNDQFEYNFSDKELHFLVIGLIGMGLVFVLYPLFRWLAKRNHEMVITWIYVFTVLTVLAFAIEIGQKITDTGTMEFADIMFGLVGFLVMFAGFSLVRMLYRWIRDWIRQEKDKGQS